MLRAGLSCSFDNAIVQIEKSGLFDAAWYVQSYPDVAYSGLDPLRHYVMYGAAVGRDPSPSFCSRSIEHCTRRFRRKVPVPSGTISNGGNL